MLDECEINPKSIRGQQEFLKMVRQMYLEHPEAEIRFVTEESGNNLLIYSVEFVDFVEVHGELMVSPTAQNLDDEYLSASDVKLGILVRLR